MHDIEENWASVARTLAPSTFRLFAIAIIGHESAVNNLFPFLLNDLHSQQNSEHNEWKKGKRGKKGDEKVTE